MENSLPVLKKKNLTERITLPVDTELKQKLTELKLVHGIDVPEWIRRIIRSKVASLDFE